MQSDGGEKVGTRVTQPRQVRGSPSETGRIATLPSRLRSDGSPNLNMPCRSRRLVLAPTGSF
eukprot:6351623-Pyramimonas_sp.AAC.1